MKKKFLDKKNCYKTFRTKSQKYQDLINETLEILHCLGMPVEQKTPRLKEKIALAFLSLADMNATKKWSDCKDIDSIQRTSREIISHQNKTYSEKRSSGSYDDVRREDLKDLTLSGIVLNTKPDSAKNDPTRKYGISKEYSNVIRKHKTPKWNNELKKILKEKGSFSDRIAAKREFKKVAVKISQDVLLKLSPGEHNELQKLIIHEFLPRFAPKGEILYFGDTAKKHLINKKEKLESLKFFELKRGMLPDIVVYRKDKNWLYLIEAVHTANPITSNRKIELESLAKNCTAKIVYVTTFMNREKLRTFLPNLAWETEVWLADDPEHMIHFNGEKFMGPY